jgi:hypothetical protein
MRSSPNNNSDYKLLKLCRQQIIKPLTYVINMSLAMGLYPERLKYAIINPVYKKGERGIGQYLQ